MGPDGAEYELGSWPDVLLDEYTCWQCTLDDVLVPVLYNHAQHVGYNVQAELVLTLVHTDDD